MKLNESEWLAQGNLVGLNTETVELEFEGPGIEGERLSAKHFTTCSL